MQSITPPLADRQQVTVNGHDRRRLCAQIWMICVRSPAQLARPSPAQSRRSGGRRYCSLVTRCSLRCATLDRRYPPIWTAVADTGCAVLTLPKECSVLLAGRQLSGRVSLSCPAARWARWLARLLGSTAKTTVMETLSCWVPGDMGDGVAGCLGAPVGRTAPGRPEVMTGAGRPRRPGRRCRVCTWRRRPGPGRCSWASHRSVAGAA